MPINDNADIHVDDSTLDSVNGSLYVPDSGGNDDLIINENDTDDIDPGGSGASAPIPGDIQAEPGFLPRYSSRLNDLLNRYTKFRRI